MVSQVITFGFSNLSSHSMISIASTDVAKLNCVAEM